MMKKSRIILVIGLLAILIGVSVVVLADDFDNDGLGVTDGGSSTGMCGNFSRTAHLTMTNLRSPTAADLERGRLILRTMRERLAKYSDYKIALADGYLPYAPSASGPVVHFANPTATAAEYAGDFDPGHPGSLLYEKGMLWGYKLVGAMYDAPVEDSPDQLDKLIPLGIARWHAHTNICLPAGVTEHDVIDGNFAIRTRSTLAQSGGGFGDRGFVSDSLRARFGFMADPRFGFRGLISTKSECEAVGGNFHAQIFAWMVHVYPFVSDDLKVAFATEAP